MGQHNTICGYYYRNYKINFTKQTSFAELHSYIHYKGLHELCFEKRFFKHTLAERIIQGKICSAKSTANVFIIAWDGERIRVLDVIVKMIQISWILQFQQQILRNYFVRKAPGQKYKKTIIICNDEYYLVLSAKNCVSDNLHNFTLTTFKSSIKDTFLNSLFFSTQGSKALSSLLELHSFVIEVEISTYY